MASDFPQIVVVSGPEEGLEYTLPSQGFIRVGRGDDNDLVLSDNSVSRHHLKIQLQNALYVVSDQNSSNGTVVEGRRLKVGQELPLTHLDEIQIGVYTLRFLQRPFDDQEAQNKKKQNKTREKYSEKAPETTPGPSADSEAATAEAPASPAPSATSSADLPKTAWFQNKKRLALLGLIALVLVAFGSWQWWRHYTQTQISEAPSTQIPDDTQAFQDCVTCPPEKPVSTSEDKPPQPSEVADAESQTEPKPTSALLEEKQTEHTLSEPQKTATIPETVSQLKSTEPSSEPIVTVLLDVSTSPFPATIYLNDERLGRAPIRKSMRLEPGRSYAVHADYELPELRDIYRETKTLNVKGNEDILTLNFDADLAKVTVAKLPRHSDFLWSGFYAYDTLQDSPVSWQRVSYGRPVYVPYGKYRLELRETASVSGSTNSVSRVVYQRDYNLNAALNTITINVPDEDLQKFPAKIQSIPTGAELELNGQKLGVTPFEGTLPVGDTVLTIKKSGFFEETFPVSMTMNAPYETTITLKTSQVGERLLKAREFMRLDQDDQAIEILIDALKAGGSDSEKSEVYYLLGQIYFKKNQVEIAESYFQRAASFEAWRDRAKIALAQLIARRGDVRLALAKLAEVMVVLNENSPTDLRNEANNAFKKISPVYSAIYIYTEPSDARVFLNDKLLEEQTPMLLSGLGLGSYRIQIEKDGFETYSTKQNLKISDFLVIKVKLKQAN